MADWNFVPLVRRLRSTDRFRPRAISRGARLNIPGGRSIAFDVSWTRRAQLAGRGRRRDCRPGTPPRDRAGFFRAIGSAVLEVLDSALVPLGRRPRREGAEVSPPSRPRVLLARVESVLSRGELPDH